MGNNMFTELFKKAKYISLDTINYDKKMANMDGAAATTLEVNQEQVSNHKFTGIIYPERKEKEKGPSIPNGAWIKCEYCSETLFHDDVAKNYQCCPKCGAHFRISARERLEMILDENSFIEWHKNKSTVNVLDFPDYDEKIKKQQMKTGMVEGVITGEGTINGQRTAIACMDSGFLMGSMGRVVGDKITRAIEKSTEKKLPIIIFTTSGGARMQEGIISLMQMAKTSAAVKQHDDAGLLYITVLTDPTTGGVTASFAMLGDIILAEPGALIGFAGPRVIEQTIGQKLPEGFQRAEFLLEKGFVDQVVERKNLKEELALLLKFHETPVKEAVAKYYR